MQVKFWILDFEAFWHIFIIFLEFHEIHKFLGDPMKSIESYGVQWNPQNPAESNEIIES